MNILIFGASGMVGQGVLHMCLADPGVSHVTVVGRTRLEQSHPKLQQAVLADLTEFDALADQLPEFDACFFCLGVSSSGMSEESYGKLTTNSR